MFAKLTPLAAPGGHVPGGSGPALGSKTGMYEDPMNAHTRIASLGFPIAASGIPNSIPVATPDPSPASHPAVTPARFV